MRSYAAGIFVSQSKTGERKCSRLRDKSLKKFGLFNGLYLFKHAVSKQGMYFGYISQDSVIPQPYLLRSFLGITFMEKEKAPAIKMREPSL